MGILAHSLDYNSSVYLLSCMYVFRSCSTLLFSLESGPVGRSLFDTSKKGGKAVLWCATLVFFSDLFREF